MPKFSPRKGAPNEYPSIDDFLKPSNTDPYQASASGQGYNARWDDDAGTRNLAGHGDGGATDNAEFLRPSSYGDSDYVNNNHDYLIDNDPSLPSGKLLPGGGALSQRGGVGAGPPKYQPKNVGHSGQQNRDAYRAGRRGR